MSEKRRDNKNRILRSGESQRKDGRYAYKYTDTFGKVQFVYAWKLVPTDKTPAGKRDDISLREKEKEIRKDLDDGIDTIGKKMTVCELYAKQNRHRGNVRHNTTKGRERLMKLLEADKQLPELELLTNSSVVEFIMMNIVKDAAHEEKDITLSRVMETIEELASANTEEEALPLMTEFVNNLRRLLKKKRTRDIRKLTTTDKNYYEIENLLNELDMHLMNASSYPWSQALLVDVLRSVDLDSITKGNYERAYADIYEMHEDQEACDACYNRLIKHSPEDANNFIWMADTVVAAQGL